MATASFRNAPPDRWTTPRPDSDPTRRRMVYGRVQPMDGDRGLIERLFGRR